MLDYHQGEDEIYMGDAESENGMYEDEDQFSDHGFELLICLKHFVPEIVSFKMFLGSLVSALVQTQEPTATHFALVYFVPYVWFLGVVIFSASLLISVIIYIYNTI